MSMERKNIPFCETAELPQSLYGEEQDKRNRKSLCNREIWCRNKCIKTVTSKGNCKSSCFGDEKTALEESIRESNRKKIADDTTCMLNPDCIKNRPDLIERKKKEIDNKSALITPVSLLNIITQPIGIDLGKTLTRIRDEEIEMYTDNSGLICANNIDEIRKRTQICLDTKIDPNCYIDCPGFGKEKHARCVKFKTKILDKLTCGVNSPANTSKGGRKNRKTKKGRKTKKSKTRRSKRKN